MTAPTPPHASPDGEMIYGKCYASYVQSVSDRDGDPDPYPDVTLLNGTAKFEAVFDGVSARGALTLPAVPRSKGIVVSGDTYEIVNSNLVDKEGREGVWLVASVDEVPITWRITVTLVNERNQTVLNSPYIVTEGLWAEEPDGSLWVNLPDLIPDPGALTPVEGSALRTAQKTLDEIRVLKDLIDTSQIDAANSAQSALTSRNEAEGFRNTAFSKAGEASDSAEAASASERSASDSEERISIEHEHVHQDVNHVDDAAAQVAAAIRQANVFSQDQVPPYLQDEELKRTYASLDGQGRQPVRKGELIVNVRDFGAKGDGTTDDTDAFDAAIAAAKADAIALTSAKVIVPTGHYRLGNLTIPSNVKIVCSGVRLSPIAGMTGAMLTFPGVYSGISGALLAGNGYTGCSAIETVTDARWNVFDDLRFDNWGGRAFLDRGVASWISRILAMNCLLDADTFTEYTGVLELTGTDAWVRDVELTASRYSVRGMSNSGMACALAIRGANHMIQNAVCETSDIGVYIGSGATQLNLVGVRGELCYLHGWLIEGGSGRIVNPMALRNSQSGDLVGDGFHVSEGITSRFIVVNPWSESSSSPHRQKYGIYDGVISRSSYNRWSNPMDIGSGTAYFANNYTGTSFTFADNPAVPLTAGSTTPNVSGLKNFYANNTAPVTVTNFLGGVNGQVVTIRGDGFTTLAAGASIKMLQGTNLLLAQNQWYSFMCEVGTWRQM